jgi:hypothetical protein
VCVCVCGNRRESTRRLERLAGHIVQQRNFYPVYPPTPGFNLDMSHRDRLTMPFTPDILLLPSKLKPFAKVGWYPCVLCFSGCALFAGVPCARSHWLAACTGTGAHGVRGARRRYQPGCACSTTLAPPARCAYRARSCHRAADQGPDRRDTSVDHRPPAGPLQARPSRCASGALTRRRQDDADTHISKRIRVEIVRI